MIGVTVALVHTWISDDPPKFESKVVVSAICGISILMALIFIIGPFRQKIILCDDAIEVVGTLRSRKMRYADIDGKRPVRANYPVWCLYSSGNKWNKVLIEMSYDFDKTFTDWLESIPEGGKPLS